MNRSSTARAGVPARRSNAASSSQWFLKITDFAEELLDGLGTLDNWPDKVRLMQENWIGKSRGLQFRFRLAEADRRRIDSLEVFTTRPDTIFGASFVAIAPDHPIAEAIAAGNPKAAAFIAECRMGGTTAAEIETAEKKGFQTGIEAIHPLDPDWRLPVYIANFVLMEYGTGAIFGVPGSRSARFRIRHQIQAADQARRCRQRRRRSQSDCRRGESRATVLPSIRSSSTA